MKLMKLSKDNTEKKENELTIQQKNDLFLNIIRGEDVTETIETSRGNFEVKFPRMKDLEAIGRLVAYRLNGQAAASFDEPTFNLINACATLDLLVLSGPAWYENAKKEENFTFGDIPSQKFLMELYTKVFLFRAKIQGILDGDKEETDSGMDNNAGDSASNKSGVFEGLSGSKQTR